ncbi:pickpocket protein 28-like isoform X1 [Leguminivora glycinivorella]|uniref:pickpocket protein 28-like isoform X1 n=2 Tax=Leguminivora glycinivorella TaxID=1035111 RepID=UPI00200C9768|nr:pickpocket protein 28-like isoform X1 [Leguminivora glycinivorella]
MKRHTRTESVGEGLPPDLENNKKLESPKKKPKRGRNNIIKDYLIDYTSNSNLHGLKYIGEKERTFVEKVFWIFMFTCCVVLCAGLIQKVYIKWNESPVIVSFAENPMPVWKIPFPAVTVCFETKAQQSKYNFTEIYHLYLNNTGNDTAGNYTELTEEEKHVFEYVSMVCDSHLSPTTGRKYGSGADAVAKLKEVCPNITESFFGCKWENINRDYCSDLFSPILTEEGICYTFNTLGAEEMLRLENLHHDYEYLQEGNPNHTTTWSLENGYPEDTPIVTYPHRGSGYGAKAGLTFIIKASEVDLDYLCRGPVQGFKILLHNPAELPRLSVQYFRAPLSQEVVVSVKPKMMTTSDGLLPYSPNIRKCYFPSERYLRYFRVYTQANCEMECLSNFTYARCGCVHFGMVYGENMTVCSAGSIQCVQNAQKELVTVAAMSSLERDSADNSTNVIDENARDIAMRCMCMPACTSIEYEAETSQADFEWRDIFTSFKAEIPPELEDNFMTRIFIFFKEAQFITSRRSELYGPTDFLANCGGLLGLFMGFSILSVVEILYFLSLRIICLFWKRRARKRVADKPTAKLEHPYID